MLAHVDGITKPPVKLTLSYEEANIVFDVIEQRLGDKYENNSTTALLLELSEFLGNYLDMNSDE